MRTKRYGVHSLTSPAADSNQADLAPIVAVLAREPIFAELALETHARFLAQGYPDTTDPMGFQQWIARDDVIR
ncbi:MAG: hypothetical protein ACM4AI_09920 [Acidobacteriota bacterium]